MRVEIGMGHVSSKKRLLFETLKIVNICYDLFFHFNHGFKSLFQMNFLKLSFRNVISFLLKA